MEPIRKAPQDAGGCNLVPISGTSPTLWIVARSDTLSIGNRAEKRQGQKHYVPGRRSRSPATNDHDLGPRCGIMVLSYEGTPMFTFMLTGEREHPAGTSPDDHGPSAGGTLLLPGRNHPAAVPSLGYGRLTTALGWVYRSPTVPDDSTSGDML